MAKANSRHVVPNPGGGWKVVKPGGDRASAVTKTQAQAEKRAKQIVANQGGGEVVVHRPGGKIRDSDTVKPGNDPRTTRDTKH